MGGGNAYKIYVSYHLFWDRANNVFISFVRLAGVNRFKRTAIMPSIWVVPRNFTFRPFFGRRAFLIENYFSAKLRVQSAELRFGYFLNIIEN